MSNESPTPEPERDQNAGHYQEMNRLLASQKSFVGAALAVFLLYWVCYFPGLIFNYIWIKDAQRVKKVAGRAPAGLGCLYIMFIAGLIPLTVFVMICVGIGGTVDDTPETPEQRRELREPRPAPPEQPAPSGASSQPRATGPVNLAPGMTLLVHEPLEMFNAPPNTEGRRSAFIDPPIALHIIGTHEGNWIEATGHRWTGDSFTTWVQVEEMERGRMRLLPDGESLSRHLPSAAP